MRKSVIHSSRAPEPAGFYSQAIRVGNLVFTSGLAGVDPRSGELVSGGIRAQVRQTLENIGAILEEAGTSLDNVIKVNAYLRNYGDFEVYNEVYSEYFDPNEPPARMTLEAGDLPGDIAVAIDVIACIPGR